LASNTEAGCSGQQVTAKISVHGALLFLFFCSSLTEMQFPAVLIAMLGSTIPISILGAKFAMSVEPFWTPIQYSASSDVSHLFAGLHTRLKLIMC